MKNVFFVLLFTILSFKYSNAEMLISSDSIKNGKIDKIHACKKKGGKNLSPQISLSNISEGTKSISIIMDDPDAVKPAGKIWVHWNVFNIPINSKNYNLASGQKPAGTIGKGHKGIGYNGMCPPDKIHTYRIAIYAQKKNVNAKVTGFSAVKYTLERFEKDFSDTIIDKIVITGSFWD